jgi:rhamnulokinase
MIEPVFHYRDPRTAEGVKRVFEKLSWPEVFAETGIQFMPINALYHLATETPGRLARTASIVPLGDAFNHFLSGVARAEATLASTTQLYNPVSRDWSARVLAAVGLTPDRFPEIVEPGTRLGALRAGVREVTGLGEIDVVACCTHDTGSAVAAVPATGGDWAYLSSGTWSLMGVEMDAPLMGEACRELNFTNEVGFGGTVRLLKNIIGLWLVQECRRSWMALGETHDYDELSKLASEAEPFRSLINPDDARFLAPENMPAGIASFCRETGQPEPRTPGEFVRCCLESLALLYRLTLRRVTALSGRRVETLHIVGGGGRNVLLNQFAADACGVRVVAGPVEATALGNVLVQAIAAGEIADLAEGRRLVAESFAVQSFFPGDADKWDAAAARFGKLVGGES